jgi:hypothetical protein
MTARGGAMHVARNRRSYVAKSGERRVYESVLVRRTYREGGKVRHETLANLSALPAEAVAAIEAALKGERLVPAGQAVTITGSLPHGHVAAVHAMAAKLGLPALLGPAGRQRDLALALVISRVVRPGSKLATLTWWGDTTLGADLGVAGASTDDIYAAMDWLARRQDAIEAGLARRHLAPAANPSKMALLDLSSSWLEGSCCPLAARGYSRDGKKGTLQIEYGLLTDPAGRPVAVRVFPGNTGDPAAFTAIVQVVREKFALAKMVMAGDRGMITSARIAALNRLEDGTARPDAYGWITALRAPAIRKLMADDGPLQLSLFDEQDLAEITSPDFPGERLAACRNPVLAADRARKRQDLLAATEKLLAPIIARVSSGKLAGAGTIGVEAGKVISKYKAGKHFTLTITGHSLTAERRQDQIHAEAALDGFYVLRTPHPGRPARRPRRGHRLQEPQIRRAGLPPHQIRRPGPAPGVPPARRTRQSPHPDLHARLLPHLAPAPRLGPADLHRPGPARPGKPRRPGPPLRRRPGQSLRPARPGRAPLPQLPRPAPPPGHPDPQPGPVPRHPRQRRHAHRAHQRTTPGLRPHRHPHPAHLEVARTPSPPHSQNRSSGPASPIRLAVTSA